MLCLLIPIMKDENVTVGVLSFHNSKETKAILNCIENMGHNARWLRKRNLEARMGSEGMEITPDVDIIINRLLLSTEDTPAELIGVASALNEKKPMLNKPKDVMVALNKVASTARLSESTEGSIPETLFSNPVALESYIEDEGESVLKDSISTHGKGTILVDPSHSVFSGIGNSPYKIAQERINQDSVSDVRSYVVNDEIVASMRRTPVDNEWRANIAQGGSATDIELSDDIRRIILDVVKVFNLDYAGVDIMKSQGNWRFLEINPTAGFKGLFGATGISPAPYICATALERLGMDVDYEKVKDISSDLDDSIPECYPRRKIVKDKPVLGLETKASVCGKKKTSEVIAKVDTGADRTSIDVKLAAEIGVGDIKDYTTVKTGSGDSSRVRPIVSLNVDVKGIKHTLKVSVEDRGNMSRDLILGRDILSMYKIDPTKDVEE